MVALQKQALATTKHELELLEGLCRDEKLSFSHKRKTENSFELSLNILSFNDVFLALKFKTLALKNTSLSARGSHFVENGYPSRFVFFYYPTPPKNFQKYAQGHAQVACVQTSPISFVARGKVPFPRATKEIGDVCTQAMLRSLRTKILIGP